MRIPAVVVAVSLLAPSLVLPQQRGVDGGEAPPPTGVRRAVIIGISKYSKLAQDKQLEYASADAREFADFLKSPAGGSVPTEKVRLMIDEEATSVAVGLALFTLRNESQAGDEAIIYFAGHGDVETLTGQRGGYLLTNDAMPGVYSMGGALGISTLSDFIKGIVDKHASVLLITDACHSGKLVGDAEGAKRTTAALLETWNKVAKIVSSGADQVSYEGKQWGGGHGAFTYFLIFGLQGLADFNGDGKVTLPELGLYITDKVKVSVKQFTGGAQTPQSNGDNDWQLAKVDSATKVAAQHASDAATKATTQVAMANSQPGTSTENRRGGNSSADSALNVLQDAFYSRVASGALLDPPGMSAWDAYEKLAKMPDAVGLMPKVTGRLGAALQSSAQAVVFDYLGGRNSQPSAGRLRRASRELSKALELFGAGYELGPPIRAQLRFLEGYAYVRENRAMLALRPLRESIALDSSGPAAYNALGFAYLALDSIADARRAFRAAVERAPRWSYPMYGIGLLDTREGRNDNAERQFQQAIDAGYSESRRDLANLYVKTNRPANAERLLSEAVKADTSNVKARADLGAFYQEQKRYAEAIQVLERVIVLDPKSVEPFIRLSIAYFYGNHAEDAVKMAQRAVGVDPTSAWGYRVLGYYTKMLKRYDESERAYRRSAQLVPSSPTYANDLGGILIALGRLPEAEAELRRAEKLKPDNADLQDNLGRLLEAQSHPDQAEIAFRYALVLDSLNSFRHDVLAGFYYRQKRFTEAEPPYRRAVQLDPKSARLAGLLGSTYQKLGRLEDAFTAYLNAIKLDSLNPTRYNDAGVIAFNLATQGRTGTAAERRDYTKTAYTAALEGFKAAARLEPTSPVYAGNVAVSYQRLERIAEAETEYKHAVALDSLNSQRYTNLASFYTGLKRYADAESAYRRAASIEPKSAAIANSLGQTYRQLNDTASAVREYLRALALDSLNNSRYTDVGIVYYWARRYEDARVAFARSSELAPQSAVAARNLGLTLAALHRDADAEREYLRAVKLDPTYVDGLNTLSSLYSSQNRTKELEGIWRALLKARPGDVNTMNSIAWTLYGRGELAEAARLSDQSLVDSTVEFSSRRNYIDTRANIALDSGNVSVALALWDRTIREDTKPDAIYYMGRAMSFLEMKRDVDAVAAYRLVLLADPKYPNKDYFVKTLGYSGKAAARLERLKALAGGGP